MGDNKTAFFVQILIITTLFCKACLVEDPIIETKLGKLRGALLSTENNRKFLAFRGIPYALPPIGDRRFQHPVPVRPWTGILNATADAESCLQLFPVLKPSATTVGDEDCLYLNVYIPETTVSSIRGIQELYPVMIFIHGGLFTVGSGSFKEYGPQRFMDTGSVIVVTINFRLGVFGFLSTEDKTSPGNYGLWDQNLALKWVQENIAEFGGDPKLVTIFGESSGAGSVVLHLLSPHSKDLFSGAICQSGSAVSDRTIVRHPLNHTKQLAINLNCPTDSTANMMQCFRKEPADEILKNTVAANQNSNNKHRFQFWPVVDKWFGGPVFVEDSPSVLLSEHRVNFVPVINGVNKDEGIFYYVKAFFENYSNDLGKLFNVSTLSQMASAISTDLMADDEKGLLLYNTLVDEYFKGVNISDIKQVIPALSQFVTDSKMNIYVDFTNILLNELGTAVYVYKLTHRGEHTFMESYPIGDSYQSLLKELGIVVHVDELRYFWMSEGSSELNVDDKKISDIVLALWTSFAKTRVPSVSGSSHEVSFEWLPITTGHSRYLNLSLNPQMVQGELTSKPDLWEKALEEEAIDSRNLIALSSSFRHKTFQKSTDTSGQDSEEESYKKHN